MKEYEIVDMSTADGRAKVEAHEKAKAEKVKSGQQLYAKIKKSSKHYSQNDIAKRDPESWGGFPFPVRIEGVNPTGYLVQGGPGGQYRLADVNLYVIENGREVRIS